jgi:hypothetical protein
MIFEEGDYSRGRVVVLIGRCVRSVVLIVRSGGGSSGAYVL